MGEALLFGVVASSPLLLGAWIGLRARLPERLLAAMLAFASGALITALAFELFEDSYEQGGLWRAVPGMIVGAVVFTTLCALLDRWAEPDDGGAHADTGEGSPKPFWPPSSSPTFPKPSWERLDAGAGPLPGIRPRNVDVRRGATRDRGGGGRRTAVGH